MTIADRRSALKLAAGFALAPLWASRVGAAEAGTASGFAPPKGPLVFQRVLQRGLVDGANVTVTRSWRVRFERTERGYLLSGRQLAANVEAPPSLAAFARLEENRVEEGHFPLLLDDSGLIAGEIGGIDVGTEVQSELQKAVGIAVRKLEPLDPENTARNFLVSVTRSAETLINRMPRDLFFPRRMEWRAREEIALPGGGGGEVAVSFDARLGHGGSMVEHARRTIVTRIGQSQRQSGEEWTLQPA